MITLVIIVITFPHNLYRIATIRVITSVIKAVVYFPPLSYRSPPVPLAFSTNVIIMVSVVIILAILAAVNEIMPLM